MFPLLFFLVGIVSMITGIYFVYDTDSNIFEDQYLIAFGKILFICGLSIVGSGLILWKLI